MKSTQNRTVARLALATWAMVATLTGAAYGQTPSVSVEAIEDTAAPGIVRAAWRFTLSAAQTTDVTISFEVSYDPAVGTNYLNIESTQILIFPAGVTTGTVSHDMSAYTGTVNGTVTATLSAGTGYTVAASPNNAATISVIAASQLIAIDLGPDVQVNEGEAANFRITWSTVNGAPAPTQHLTYVLAPVSGTAIIAGEVDAANIVTGSGISTDANALTRRALSDRTERLDGVRDRAQRNSNLQCADRRRYGDGDPGAVLPRLHQTVLRVGENTSQVQGYGAHARALHLSRRHGLRSICGHHRRRRRGEGSS